MNQAEERGRPAVLVSASDQRATILAAPTCRAPLERPVPLDPRTPFLLLRARVKPEYRDPFGAWFREAHQREATAIPGIVEMRTGLTAESTFLGFYSFASAEVVPAALQSPEAVATRRGWEQWNPHLDEFHVEMFAPLGVMPIYHGPN